MLENAGSELPPSLPAAHGGVGLAFSGFRVLGFRVLGL